MIEQDTIKLLRECDAGIQMGVKSIEDVLEYAGDPELRRSLSHCKKEHEQLAKEIEAALERFHDDGKEPNPVAQGMSWMKTTVKLAMNDSDHTIADLITDGCGMGVKSLSKYLNQYQAADESAKDITRRLIRMEEQLAENVRRFL